eukprot:TRINITY_DN71732_c0_g1_i1.p1 TRINITY_DN71732_c0_g1~~TRINITY_DN71732_c0_g1_i1.p1  ORF type:complete len:391 (-),score=93.74 TRINITY_DN71732_c0_g1_i1:71-1135(-)
MAETKLFVGGLPAASASNEYLADIFRQCGAEPSEVVLLPAKGSNTTTRCGFVKVPEAMVADLCVTLNGAGLEGEEAQLQVRIADKQGPASAAVGGGAAVVTPAVVPGRIRPPTGAPPAAAAGTGAVVVGPRKGAVAPTPIAPRNGGGADATSQKAAAMAAGNWLEAAQWAEQENQGESPSDRFQRLSVALHTAAVQEQFYEAAAIMEVLTAIDPSAAQQANETAAAAASALSRLAQAQQGAGAVGVSAGAQQVGGGQAVAPKSSWFGTVGGEGAHSGAAGSHVGKIITFNPERHFGFISCPELGQDAFLSEKQVQNFQVGDVVSFDVTYNQQGKPQAQNLAAASMSDPKRARLA